MTLEYVLSSQLKQSFQICNIVVSHHMKDQGLEVKKVNPLKDGLLILCEIVKYFFNRKIN